MFTPPVLCLTCILFPPIFHSAVRICAIRTGYRGANSFHNSNRITYKRLVDWRAMLTGLRTLRVGGALGTATLQPARFDSGTHEYMLTVPAADTVEVTAGFFGRVLDGPVQQTVAASIDAGPRVQLQSDVATSLVFPQEKGSATLTLAVTSSVLRARAERTASVTNYTVVVRRSVPVAAVTGQGFEMRTVVAGGGTNVAWRDRSWNFAQLPAALIGLNYTMITCLEKGGSCGTLAHPPVAIDATVVRPGVMFVVIPVFVGWCEHTQPHHNTISSCLSDDCG